MMCWMSSGVYHPIVSSSRYMISVSSVYAHASQRQGSVSDRPYSLPRIPGISRNSHSTPEPKVFDTWVQWLSSGLSSRNAGLVVSQSSAEPQQASDVSASASDRRADAAARSAVRRRRARIARPSTRGASNFSFRLPILSWKSKS